MRPYPSAAPVTTPSNSPRTARISGHAVESSHEVHLGCARVGERDLDAVRHEGRDDQLRAVHSAPAECLARSGSPGRFPGPRIPFGSNACFNLCMSPMTTGSPSSRKKPAFARPRPCSPEIAPPASMPAFKKSVDEVVAYFWVGLEHRQVDVPVSRVTAAGHERSVLGSKLSGPSEVRGDGRSRNDNVDDVVDTARLGHEEGALSAPINWSPA